MPADGTAPTQAHRRAIALLGLLALGAACHVHADVGPTPSFAARQAFTTGSSPRSAVVADLNGDGKPDLVAANYDDGTLSVLLNATAPGDGTPAFAPQQPFAAGAAPSAVTAVDLNGDGKVDLVATNLFANTVSVLLNTTPAGAVAAAFSAAQTFPTGTSPESVVAADVNGDGRPDLVVANYGSTTVSVLLNNTAPGAATPAFAAQATFGTGSGPISVATCDVNGDGKPDLVVADFLATAVSVLLNTTATGAATPTFAVQQAFPVGTQPYAVAVADLNGDGRPDIAAANEIDDNFSVLLNTTAPGAASPAFTAQTTFVAGVNPFAIAAEDVNGDGRPDLVAAISGALVVLRNLTVPGAVSPDFSAARSYDAGFNARAVAVADLNGDARADLVVANDFGTTVGVLLNTTAMGAASVAFAARAPFATGPTPAAAAAADVNGDGKRDLVVANGDDTVSVLLNAAATGAATPSFATQQTFATGSVPYSVAAADVNGDGRPDVIVGNQGDNTISVLLNTTAPGAPVPSFAGQQAFGTANAPRSVTIADVNGDGRPDAIVATFSSLVSVLLNATTPGAGTPSFAAAQSFATGASSTSSAAADVNGDGRPDVIVANRNDDTVSVLLNTTAPGAATPSFAAQQTFGVQNFPVSVNTADVNGDGRPDLVVANYNSGTVSVLLDSTPPGAATPAFSPAQSFFVGGAAVWAAASDVNGDGRPDLVAASVSDNAVSVLIDATPPGASTPAFGARQSFGAGSSPYFGAVADFNGDGERDVVVPNFGASSVSVLLDATTLGPVPTTGSDLAPLPPLPDPPAGARNTGSAVAVAPGIVVAGAPNADVDGNTAGAVFVYTGATLARGAGGAGAAKPGSTRKALADVNLATLQLPFPLNGDKLGLSGVAVSRDGSTVVAGAPGVNNGQGAVYVFKRPPGGWSAKVLPSQTLVPPNTFAGYGVGTTVTMTNSGTVLVGAPGAQAGGQVGAGKVYVLRQSGADYAFAESLSSAAPQPDAQFGAAIAGEGADLVVGSPNQTVGQSSGQGAIVTFREPTSGGPYTLQDLVVDPNGHFADKFGAAVGINDGTVVVGSPGADRPAAPDAGVATIFEQGSGGNLQPVATLADPTPDPGAALGSVVQIRDRTIAVSAPLQDLNGYNDQGAVLVYVPTAPDLPYSGTLTPTAVLYNPIGQPGDRYGASFALGDGLSAAGAPDVTSQVAAKALTGTVTSGEVIAYSDSLVFRDGFESPRGLVGTCAQPGTAIPDNDATGIDSEIALDAAGDVKDLNVSVRITHSFASDLHIALEHVPSGTTIPLYVASSDCPSDNLDVDFDDQALDGYAKTSCSGAAPAIEGRLLANEWLAVMRGKTRAGPWRLNVSDVKAADSGTLDAWCIDAR